MDNRSIAYSAKELLTTLQGPALMQIIASPVELRMLVDSLDGISGIADYLAETEQRLYPKQAPQSRKIRNNRVRVVTKQPLLTPRESHEDWVLTFVERWVRKHKQGPAIRDIRNYNRSKWQGDTSLIIEDLVSKGKLCKTVDGRSVYYTLPEETTN